MSRALEQSPSTCHRASLPPSSLRSSPPAAPPVFSENPGEENCHVRSSGERIDTESIQTASDIGITEPAHIYSLQPCLSDSQSVCYMWCECVSRAALSFFNPFCMQAKFVWQSNFSVSEKLWWKICAFSLVIFGCRANLLNRVGGCLLHVTSVEYTLELWEHLEYLAPIQILSLVSL